MKISKAELIPELCKAHDKECMNENIKINIDGEELIVKKGTTVLEACKKVGKNIPTLCHHQDLRLSGICRVCAVDIDGKIEASCSYSIGRSMNIITNSEKIRQSRKAVVELLLSKHDNNCPSCHRNLNCELQKLAQEFGIDQYKYGTIEEKKFSTDKSSHSIVRDMNKCILCRRCVRTCIDLQGVGCYHVEGRSSDAHIDTFAELPMESTFCINCGQCVNRCPTGALSEKDQCDEVFSSLSNENKTVIIQTAPAPRAGIGECFGLEPGVPLTYQMNTALKQLGFDYVFDTCFSADLTIIEEGSELLERLANNGKLPMFTSCSPGWIKFLEHFYPEFIPNLSTVKSPQQIFGALIKSYFASLKGINPENIVTVALMPCTAKKFEADREEMYASGYKDVDYGITTRELAKMLKECRIDLPKLPPSNFDSPFYGESGSGVIFGSTGGVMESAIRTLYNIITGLDNRLIKKELTEFQGNENIRYYELKIDRVQNVPDILKDIVSSFDFLKGAVLKLGVVHGAANAGLVLDNIKEKGIFSQCHFIEFMACEGGCLGGGGQPIPTNKEIREKRKKAIYDIDSHAEIKNSYENPTVAGIYKDYLQKPLSHTSHKYLHTKYIHRGHIYKL